LVDTPDAVTLLVNAVAQERTAAWETWYRTIYRHYTYPAAWKGGAKLVNAQGNNLMRVGDVQKSLKVSRSMAYNLCNGKNFPVVKLGRVTLVFESDLLDYLSKNTIN